MKNVLFVKRLSNQMRGFLDHGIPSLVSQTSCLGNINSGSPTYVSIDKDNFFKYSYSKRSHFFQLRIPDFREGEYIDYCNLKVYQDILIYNFLMDNFPPGARLLEIGGGDSRVINNLRTRYECWNLDKLEGKGYGPRTVQNPEGYVLVKDFIGDFSSLLSNEYFDCVFSISVLEHIPENDDHFKRVVADIHRVLKPGGFSIHCIDIILKEELYTSNPILNYLCNHIQLSNPLIPFSQINADPDLWVLPRYAYYTRWISHTRQLYGQFGRPFSYNILWQKIEGSVG